MRYRTLDANLDMTFGEGGTNFLINSPAAVGQLVYTRLLLLQGEWFLDIFEGTPYATQILGKGTSLTYDNAIRARILGTEGVLRITAYDSNLVNRALTVEATIDTLYGEANLPITTLGLPPVIPVLP